MTLDHLSPGAVAAHSDAPILELRDVWKAFPGQMVLQGVDLDLYPGRVTGLLGQNGSGKSTLIKILAGFHLPASGAKGALNGKELAFGSPRALRNDGLRFVHQELDLIDDLSIFDNLALVNGYARSGILSIRREIQSAVQMLHRSGLHLDVRSPVSTLSPVEKTLVAICRALGDIGSAKVLVLDEPTTALPAVEVQRLFDSIREQTRRGLAILYVSHNLEEILDIADWVTVLRDGAVVATEPTHIHEVDSLAHLIAGREIEKVKRSVVEEERPSSSDALLAARGIGGMTIRDVSFSIRPGEIVGVAGLLGSGREELPYLLTGALPLLRGDVTLKGKPLARLTPQQAMECGIVLVASDRTRQSAIQSLTARENVMLPVIPKLHPRKWVTRRRERNDASDWMGRVDVRPLETEKILSTFSGGNQQKIVIARALRSKPAVLVLDEPVQGVDVAAKASIFHHLIESAKKEGLAALVCSSDAEVLTTLCERTLVLKKGRISAELVGHENTTEAILARMAG